MAVWGQALLPHVSPFNKWNVPRWPPSAVARAPAAAPLLIPPPHARHPYGSVRATAHVPDCRAEAWAPLGPHAVVWALLSITGFGVDTVLRLQAFVRGDLLGRLVFYFRDKVAYYVCPSWPRTYRAGHMGLKLKEILLPNPLSTEITEGTEDGGERLGGITGHFSNIL